MVFHRGRHISLRRTVLLTADIVCVAGAIIASAYFRLAALATEYIAEHWPSLVGSWAVFLLVFYAGGMYERQALTRRGASIRLPLMATLIGLTIIIVVFYARLQFNIGRGILLLAALFIFLSTCLIRQFYRAAVRHGLLSKNTLIVGDGREVRDVIHLVESTPDSGLRVLGVVSCNRIAPGEFIERVPVIGTLDRLRELAEAFSAESIIVATSMAREPAVLRLLRPLRCAGTEVTDYIGLHEMLAQEIPLDHINDEWLMNAAMNSSVIHIRKIKRIMDVLASVIGLILGALPMAITALLVRLDSRGPIFYRQRRCGLDGSVFTLFKFRTMRQDAEAVSGAVWAGQQDSRVTRVGRLLRSWRLDEIPQLINVLRGEMSLVGPRPERPEFVDTLAAAIPFYKERLLVPPGVTGWAQVKYPYAASIEAARRKLQYDLYYIKHMSFFLDCLILLRTFKTIVIGIRHSEMAAPAPAPATEEAVALPAARTTSTGTRTA